MSAELFKDESPFVGWVEFKTGGGKMRGEYIGGKQWALYEQQSGGAFVRFCTVQAGKGATCNQLWDAIQSELKP